MREVSFSNNLEKEAEWIESTVMRMLDKHITQIRVTTRSKRWWTMEEEVKQNEYG